MENEWAPPDHEVFQLVPREFDLHARRLYHIEGSPVISHSTFLATFQMLRDAFRPFEAEHPLGTYVASHDQDYDREQQGVAILQGLRDMRPGDELGPSQGFWQWDEDEMVPSIAERTMENSNISSGSFEPEGGPSRSIPGTLEVDFSD